MKNKIRFFRRRKGMEGMSQRELAKRVGTWQNVISDYEILGRPVPKARRLLIAQVLGEDLGVVFPNEKEAG